MSYKYNKKWRLLHTKLRNEGRKRYYVRFQSARMSRKRWDIGDSDFVIMSKLSDRALSILLGRSVQAIQVKRCELMKGG